MTAPVAKVKVDLLSADRPRVPREKATTYLVVGRSETAHVVTVVLSRDRGGAWIVEDEYGRSHQITYDALRRRWVGVPLS